jgi:hypothetical protein
MTVAIMAPTKAPAMIAGAMIQVSIWDTLRLIQMRKAERMMSRCDATAMVTASDERKLRILIV